MPDRHKNTPLRFRPPEAERLWLDAYQQQTSRPMNAILTEAVQRLREAVAPSPAASPEPPCRPRRPRAAKAEPESAPETPPRRRCTHPGRARVIGGYCPACDHLTEPGGYWRD